MKNLTKQEQKDEAFKAYHAIVNLAYKAYQVIDDPAWKAYREIHDPAHKAYQAIREPAREAYEAKLKEIDEQERDTMSNTIKEDK